ncbi:MAG: hypothetical protein ACTHJS_15810 [Xanthobacteraceae bacterium]|jgi:hypothetical protein
MTREPAAALGLPQVPSNAKTATPTYLEFGTFLIPDSLRQKALVTKMALPTDAQKMRQRASRLLDLATRSRCEGRGDFAGLLTDLATEILDHARSIEQRLEREDNSKSSRPDAA